MQGRVSGDEMMVSVDKHHDSSARADNDGARVHSHFGRNLLLDLPAVDLRLRGALVLAEEQR